MQRTTTTDKLLGSPPGTTAVMFNKVQGVQIRADIVHPYDTFGKHVRHVGPVLPETMGVIEDFVQQLQRLAARKMEALVLCSVWRRAKEGETVNRHAEGRAIDIGGIWWSRMDGITAWGYGRRRRHAVGVEAALRMSFDTVLGPTSNLDHAHHWHAAKKKNKKPALTQAELDASRGGVRKVEVVYVQDACSTVHGIRLAQDGLWGPKTEAAVAQVLTGLSVDSPVITDPDTYRAFNMATALVGFGHVEVNPGPTL